MEKESILNELDLIFERINNIGFMGTNEYELHLKDEIADWVLTLLPQKNVIKSVCDEQTAIKGIEDLITAYQIYKAQKE